MFDSIKRSKITRPVQLVGNLHHLFIYFRTKIFHIFYAKFLKTESSLQKMGKTVSNYEIPVRMLASGKLISTNGSTLLEEPEICVYKRLF